MKLMLRELREARGLKPRQMYERLGVEDSRYRKWESEAAQIPLEYAILCCDVLHCTLDELAGRTPISLTSGEQELLECYRSTDERGRETILAVAHSQSGMEGKASVVVVGS